MRKGKTAGGNERRHLLARRTRERRLVVVGASAASAAAAHPCGLEMPHAGPVHVGAAVKGEHPHQQPQHQATAAAARKRKRVSRRDARDEAKMDANRLIAEVFKRPALWNQRHVSYHNREVTNRVWMEISAIFKLPKPVLKAKWKGLRDTFRAELKKEQVYRKSKHQRNRPLWIHYESLQFLREQMLPRPPVWERNNKNYQNGINCDDEFQRDFDDSLTEHLLQSSIARSVENIGQEEMDLKDESQELFDEVQYHENSPLNRVAEGEVMMQNISPEDVLLNASVSRNGLINGEGDSEGSSIVIPMEYINNHHCDDNYYFFVSLLPHMKQLSAERKMFLRMKIQELVYEEVYKKNVSSSQENPTTS